MEQYFRMFMELYASTRGTPLRITLVQTGNYLMYKYHTDHTIGIHFEWDVGVGMSTIKFVLEQYVALLQKYDLIPEHNEADIHCVVFPSLRCLDKLRWDADVSIAQMRSRVYDSTKVFFSTDFYEFTKFFQKLGANEFFLFTRIKED